MARTGGVTVRVHPLATDATRATIGPRDVAIVVDLLRASTTIATALAAGAAWVRPVMEVQEARAARTEEVLIGGERGGIAPAGFDLGNSPREYTPERVHGRGIVFTTSNGTRAIGVADVAGVVLVGALVNLTATAEHAARAVGDAGRVHVVCAGTGGGVTEEDVLCAGALVEALADFGVDHEGDDARDALRHWATASGSGDDLRRALRASRGGRNLIAVGLESDIDDVARIDEIATVASLDRRSGLITTGERA